MAFLIDAPDNLILSEDANWITIESEQMSGTPGDYTPDQDNLSAYLEIWDEVDSVLIVTLSAPFSGLDKRVQFNLRSIFYLTPTIPTTDSLTHQATVQFDEATGSFTRFKLKFADQYGSPAEPEIPLTESAESMVVLGGVSKFGIPFASLGEYFLHNFRNEAGERFNKPVRTDQVEWIYFRVDAVRELEWVVRFFYTDGTFDELTVPDTAFTPAAANSFNWVQAGWDQLDLGSIVDGAKTCYSFRLTLADSDGLGGRVDEIDFDIIQDYSDQRMTLLYHNGLGGMETVILRGHFEKMIESEKTISDGVEWSDFSTQTGTKSAINEQLSQQIKMNTGFYSKEYIYHLRQLIKGDVWLVDGVLERFYKYVISSTSIKYDDSQERKYFLELEMIPAWTEHSLNDWRG